jgi:hypothetical protein
MLIPLAWMLASLLAGAAVGDSPDERASLTGLTTVSVVVEALPPIAERSGLSASALQKDVEQRLQRAGISVTPDADAYLYVHVTVSDPGASLPVPFVVDVSLMQEVTLPRGLKTRAPLQCPTWGVNRLGQSDASRLSPLVTDRVQAFADQFVAAYRSVNPK